MTDLAQQIYERLYEHVRRTSLLESIAAALDWDERTMMPAAGSEYRAEQMTALSGMIHQRWTDPRVGRLARRAGRQPAWPTTPTATRASPSARSSGGTSKKVKLPHVAGRGAYPGGRPRPAGVAGRPAGRRFRRLRPVSGDDRPAEARSRPRRWATKSAPTTRFWTTTSRTSGRPTWPRVLAGLRDELVPLVDADRRQRAAAGRLDPRAQLSGRRAGVVRPRGWPQRIGFDFDRGRLDVTAHPFCSGLGPNDCRITTRYDEHAFGQALFGILHEAGHGIYDQGLPAEQYGLPLGRRGFAGHPRVAVAAVGKPRRPQPGLLGALLTPRPDGAFPRRWATSRWTTSTSAINDVRPSLIRVEADEATYNLHILVRFELEQALLAGDLAVADLPAAWNEKYRRYLGIEPPGDADGVLQDIHWSGGAIGYFPTYSLGNLYAAQFFAQAEADLGGLADAVRPGRVRAPLRRWLRREHPPPRPTVLGRRAGRPRDRPPLSHAPLIAYLRRKLGPLYGFS